jgi:uracil permease
LLLVGAVRTLGSGPPAVYGAMALGGGERLDRLLGVRLYTPPVLASTLLLLIVSLTPNMRYQMFDPGRPGLRPGPP